MKRAIAVLNLDAFEDLLNLPEGVHLKAVRDNWHHLGIDLLLEGEGLDVEEHAPGTEPMRVELSIKACNKTEVTRELHNR